MREYSDVFNRYYEQEDGILILNPKQCAFYLEHGVPLLDVYSSNGELVLVFQKSVSREYYKIWKSRNPHSFRDPASH